MIGELVNHLADWALRASLLIGVVAVLTILLRRRAASLRHALWAFAIAGSLALPLLASVFPEWRILPTQSEEPAPKRETLATATALPEVISIPVAAPTGSGAIRIVIVASHADPVIVKLKAAG